MYFHIFIGGIEENLCDLLNYEVCTYVGTYIAIQAT